VTRSQSPQQLKSLLGRVERAVEQRTRRLLAGPARGVLYGFADRPWGPMAFPPGHFHSPLPSYEDITRHHSSTYDRDADLPGIDLGIDAQLKLLRDIYPDIDAHPFHERDGARPRFDFDNTWFTSYDALVYSALLRAFEPKRIVEVGSGWSTAIILDTYEGAQPPDITLIEPHPDRLFTLLRDSDHARLTILEQRLQDCPLTLFEELGDGDVLFVDSTHVAKLDSDVNQLFFEILPRLNVGVLVHLHDVAYPFDYEPDMIDQGFGWNEAYLLRAFLQFNDRFEIVLWNDLLRTRFRSLLEEECPVLIEHECPGTEGSIWIRRVR